VLTKVTRYKKEGKNHATVRHYRRGIRGALLSLARTVLLCTTPEQVDAAAGLAQVISASGMSNRNYLLFITLLETNNPAVVDILVGRRNPFLLFASIKPNWFLLKETFRILAKFKGNELSEKALLAFLGVVQCAYKTSKDGYAIYPLRMSDIYTIGKYLDKERDQLDPRNRLLLEILYDIYFVGIDSERLGVKRIGIKANDIRMAFFDNTKRLLDAIPDVLLVKDYVRVPVAPRNFAWQPVEQTAYALEAREAPELKVGLRERMAPPSAPARPPAARASTGPAPASAGRPRAERAPASPAPRRQSASRPAAPAARRPASSKQASKRAGTRTAPARQAPRRPKNA
jgi:hypothetical protein